MRPRHPERASQAAVHTSQIVCAQQPLFARRGSVRRCRQRQQLIDNVVSAPKGRTRATMVMILRALPARLATARAATGARAGRCNAATHRAARRITRATGRRVTRSYVLLRRLNTCTTPPTVTAVPCTTASGFITAAQHALTVRGTHTQMVAPIISLHTPTCQRSARSARASHRRCWSSRASMGTTVVWA